MNSWVFSSLNWSWGWHIKRKCKTGRLRFHLDTSRWIWNREIDLKLVHIKTVINFVLTDESGAQEKRRKPRENSSTRPTIWANIFLPYFHVHVITCAFYCHLLQQFLILTKKSDFPQPEAFREALQYKNIVPTVAYIFRGRNIHIFQFWESKWPLTYVQKTISSKLYIEYCMQVRTILYDALKREKWSFITILTELNTEASGLPFCWQDTPMCLETRLWHWPVLPRGWSYWRWILSFNTQHTHGMQSFFGSCRCSGNAVSTTRWDPQHSVVSSSLQKHSCWHLPKWNWLR